MSKTPVDICNKALDLLGQVADIGNIETPTTDNEKVCARWYSDTLGFLLRRYMWNFAVWSAELPKDLVAKYYGYSDAYKLPSDFVRLVSIDGNKALNLIDYKLAGGYLFLNGYGDSIHFEYIRLIKDVTEYDEGFKQLLTLYLAANMAFRFTNKQTVVERLYKMIEVEEAKIISIDGQEQPPTRIQYSKYRRARHGYTKRNNFMTRPVKFVTEDDNASS